MIRFVIALLLATCSSVAFAASNCITSGNVTSWTYFVAVDSSDKTTRETGLSSFTVYRSRNGGTATAFTTPTVNETSSGNMPGVYELLLDEDMTVSGNAVEHMALHITHAGMEPVTKEICIAPALDDGVVASGTAQAGTNSTIQLASETSFDDNALFGATIRIVSGTGAGQSRAITDWVSSTDTATVAPNWTTNPSSDSIYRVYGTAPVEGAGGVTAEEVWAYSDRTITGGTVTTVSDKTGYSLSSSQTFNLTGNISGSVGSVTGNVGGTVNGLTSTAQGHVRTSLGMSSANLDTQLGDLPTNSELTSALSSLAAAGVYSLGYRNGDGDECVMVISESDPKLDVTCTEAE